MRYDFECPAGHREEHVFAMEDVPAVVDCDCGRRAARVFAAPTIHMEGQANKLGSPRRRRPNPGDSLPRFHDPEAAAIARAQR